MNHLEAPIQKDIDRKFALRLKIHGCNNAIAKALEHRNRIRDELVQRIRLEVAEMIMMSPADSMADQALESWERLYRITEARRMHERAIA